MTAMVVIAMAVAVILGAWKAIFSEIKIIKDWYEEN